MLLSSDKQVCSASVLVDRTAGTVVQVATNGETCSMTDNIDSKDLEIMQLTEAQVLMPGLVDAHGKEKGGEQDKKA